MLTAPSILLLDDGELGRVRRVLAGLGVAFEHWRGGEGSEGVLRPRHLLVTSLRLAQEMPKLGAVDESAEPVWVCAHNQDFLPLRERLRRLGVHYLVHSALDPEVLRLFFLQLLHRGGEQRRNPRLPLSCALRYELGAAHGKGRLEEISRGGCRLVAAEEVPVGARAAVFLPRELARGEELALSGYVTHCSPEAGRSGGRGHSVIVVFRDLEVDAQAQLEALLGGRDLGTRIAPLGPLPTPAPRRRRRGGSAGRRPAPRPAGGLRAARAPAPPADAAAAELELTDEDRRVHPRREYLRQLTAIHADASEVLLGRDLSLTGLRVDPHPSLCVGARVSIALYGRPREEPLVVAADVLRQDAAGGFGLRFAPLAPAQRAWLERLLERLPPLEALAEGRSGCDPLVVSKLVHAGD